MDVGTGGNGPYRKKRGMTPKFDLTDRLRKAREVAGMSQDQLAERMGVSRSTVSNYEAGVTTNPRRIVIKGWAEETGCDYDWLMFGEEAPIAV